MAEADAPLLVERTDDDVVIATLRNGKVNALSNRVLDAIGDAAAEWAKDPPRRGRADGRAQALCCRCRYRPVRRLRRRG